MEHTKSRGTYLYSRIDSRSGRLYIQGRDWTLHLAGKTDKEKGWDRYIFSAAKNVLGETDGEKFKQDMISVLRYMAEVNRVGETTKAFSPLLVMYGPSDNEIKGSGTPN